MSINLGTLYHWSPFENRESIIQSGLLLHRPASDGYDYRAGYICLATTPSSAFGLIPGPYTNEWWDLWQVVLSETDKVEISSDFTPYIREVRVYNGLPVDRIWYVGSRHSSPAIDETPQT